MLRKLGPNDSMACRPSGRPGFFLSLPSQHSPSSSSWGSTLFSLLYLFCLPSSPTDMRISTRLLRSSAFSLPFRDFWSLSNLVCPNHASWQSLIQLPLLARIPRHYCCCSFPFSHRFSPSSVAHRDVVTQESPKSVATCPT